MLRKVMAISLAAYLTGFSVQAMAAEGEKSEVEGDVAASEMQYDAVTFPMTVFDEQQTKAIEDIVRNYLLEHPELLVEISHKLQQQQLEAQEQQYNAVIEDILKDEDIPVDGDADAKHYLIEFFDYNCGYCKAAREIMYRLAEEEDLKVYYVEMPVLSPMSVQASAIGLTLLQEDRAKYFEYQKYLMSKKGRIDSEDQIKEAVEKVGADFDKLSETFKSDAKVQAILRKNMEYGERLGVQGVPLFVLDGHIIRGAVKDYDSLKGYLKKDEAE